MSKPPKMWVYMLIIVFAKVSCEKTAVVELKQGLLSGKVEQSFLKQENYFSFKGVPYAKPPVGELRFLPPQPHEGWEETYEAFENNPTCLQLNARMRNEEAFGISGAEDCLYLSVYTPSLDPKYGAPVVVFDYNDNFKLGFNGSDTYSPDFFIEEDVIVVTITHRLGLFGYLTTEDDVIPPNAGLKDFILGLEWIKDNIEHFGGDPNKVTLMGNRGGAAIANILLYSVKASNLFSAVILQSGTAFEPIYFFNDPSIKAFELGTKFAITTDDSKTLLSELQNIKIDKLLSKEVEVIDDQMLKLYQRGVQPFGPIVEKNNADAIVKTLPEDGKIVNDVPVLIGFNSRDGVDFASMFIMEPRLLQDIGDALSKSFHLPIRPGFRFERDSAIFEEALKEVSDFYFTDGYLHVENLLEYAVKTGDELEMYAVDYSVKRLADVLKSPVFYYMFDFRGSLNENSENIMRYARFPLQNWGATITDELCYLHFCSRIKKNYKNLVGLVSEQPEMKILKKMVRMWTNFAKGRNPTPENDSLLKDIVWSPVEKGQVDANYLHIKKTFKMKQNPLGNRSHFWNNFLEKYSKIAVDGVVGDEITNRDEL